MDKLIFTAIASLSQIKTDQAQSSNELANMSSIGFKKAFDHATETRRVGARQPRCAREYGYRCSSARPRPPHFNGSRYGYLHARENGAGGKRAQWADCLHEKGDLSINEAGILVEGSNHEVLAEGGGVITVPVVLNYR